MEPKDVYKKKIIGKLSTRIIDKLHIDHVPASIESEKEYDILDVVQKGSHKFFVVNAWDNEETNTILAIHNNFVKDFILNEQ